MNKDVIDLNLEYPSKAIENFYQLIIEHKTNVELIAGSEKGRRSFDRRLKSESGSIEVQEDQRTKWCHQTWDDEKRKVVAWLTRPEFVL